MEVSNLIIEMNQRAFLTAPPRMNLLEYPLDYLPMEAHQLQLLTSFSVHGAARQAHSRPLATRKRAGGAPSERRLSLAPAAR